MRYKNIIFDFGNVIGKFKGDYILGKFASTPEDYNILADAIFKNWVALDAGTIDYDQNAEDTIAELPDRLKDTARDFFENWFQYVDPLPETWKFIKELKARGVPIYLLSNASTRFAERAPEDYPILKEFDGIVFSAPLKMAPDFTAGWSLWTVFQVSQNSPSTGVVAQSAPMMIALFKPASSTFLDTSKGWSRMRPWGSLQPISTVFAVAMFVTLLDGEKPGSRSPRVAA
jgi:putative hydrolase of the HAD superfamily